MIYKIFKWSNFRNEYQLLNLLHYPKIKNLSDKNIYKYYNFNETEIIFIEKFC